MGIKASPLGFPERPRHSLRQPLSITVEELLRGWYTQVRRARDDEQLARAYQALQETVEFTRQIQILPFNRPAIARYRDLRIRHRRSRGNDLRIAAISDP